MCVIIVSQNPHKHPLVKDEVSRALRTNPDGWGLAALFLNGEIEITKGFDDKRAWQTIQAAQKAPNISALVFHSRIATSGMIDTESCHPYPCPGPDKTPRFLFHNGILSGIPLLNQAKSDTWHLATDLRRYADTENLYAYLDEYASENHSRFVVVTSQGVAISNRKSGVERYGKWYSGYSAFKPTYTWTSGEGYTFGKWNPGAAACAKANAPSVLKQLAAAEASWDKTKGDRKTVERLRDEHSVDVLDVTDQHLQDDEEFIRFVEGCQNESVSILGGGDDL